MPPTGPVILYLLEPCIRREETQALATHKSDAHPGTSLLSPSQEHSAPLLGLGSSSPSIPCSNRAHRLFGPQGMTWVEIRLLGCLQTSASTPETETPHNRPSESQEPDSAHKDFFFFILCVLLQGKEYHKKYPVNYPVTGHIHGHFLASPILSRIMASNIKKKASALIFTLHAYFSRLRGYRIQDDSVVKTKYKDTHLRSHIPAAEE